MALLPNTTQDLSDFFPWGAEE